MEHPRFSWIVEEDTSAQEAYGIRVWEKASGKTVWDSGTICSNETLNIAYDELYRGGL